ncbi:flagellar biosynthetic protein FliO [Brucella haematophila]|uniref:FliO/MopB family protein n=1 Tax=Brucella haematophila TaxID=419474 RepID=A0ABX1DNF4_9HYPH|nr:flagellar biosynthetic protein FliO [Brucella haematophila]NKC02822.1 FliO/MopB family protein [Brucella haematophila]TMV03550.1 hypothetical protein FGI60_10255 [Brucella haematophila]
MKEWLSGIVGESAANIVGFVLIFAIILGGIFVVLSIIRRFSGGSFTSNSRSRQPRLSVMDAAAVDSRRKLVLIRRDDVEHLLLIGGPTDVVVEQNIVMESRAHARVQTSRIEPEHIERFRQHEATIASDVSERPALSSQNSAPESAPEKDEAIQLSSAIETPVYRKPEPPKEEPVRQEAPQVVAPRVPPRPPVTPTVAPAAPQAPARPPVAPPVQAAPQNRPQPRPAPNYPPQPRTVLPAQPPQPSQPPARAHPAYPLSQVSRGVVSSTSNLATTATVAAGAAAATVASANLGSIVPEREPASTPTTALTPPLDVTSPSVSSTVTPDFTSVAEPKRVEPEVTVAAPAQSAPATEDDGLEGLGGALHDAIMADLETETAPAKEEAPTPEPDLTADFFEDELLSSLDISATDDTPSDDIEDEMEKLLGELTKNETRP